MPKDQFITKSGLAKLEQELGSLKKLRREIANRIQEAKELGDLSENAEYTEAKIAQAFNEGRIQEIEEVLKNAVLIKKGQESGVVKPGSTLKVLFNDVEKTLTVVGSNESDPANGLISNESPLGQAFMDKKVGETVEVVVPKGKMTYKILEIV